MLKGAHLFFGLGVVSFITLDPVILALSAFLSVMSDLDHPIKHRAWFSHSLFAAFVFSVVGFIASQFQIFYALAVFLAMSSHVLLDFLTYSGVPILYPWKHRNYSMSIFRSDNMVANKIFVFLGMATLTFNVWLVYGHILVL
jgi:inner membrane protein